MPNSVTSIKGVVDSRPRGSVTLVNFYLKPSDAPSTTGNWAYLALIFKSSATENIIHYILLFYVDKLFYGRYPDSTEITWNQIYPQIV